MTDTAFIACLLLQRNGEISLVQAISPTALFVGRRPCAYISVPNVTCARRTTSLIPDGRSKRQQELAHSNDTQRRSSSDREDDSSSEHPLARVERMSKHRDAACRLWCFWLYPAGSVPEETSTRVVASLQQRNQAGREDGLHQPQTLSMNHAERSTEKVSAETLQWQTIIGNRYSSPSASAWR